MTSSRLESAYGHCLKIAQGHYENFPVASRLLPRHLRRPIAAIYAFARAADDLADEGDAPPQQRLAQLNEFQHQLDAIEAQQAVDNPVFFALADTIYRHHLPMGLFYDLLTAFKQDVTQHRYANFAAVLNYCHYSANPVGRLLLHLYNEASEKNLAYSDKICTALQLINFYQDLKQDYEENERIYIPEDEMRQFGVDEEHFYRAISDTAMRGLFHHQVERARGIMLEGAPLGNRLKGRFGLEIRLIIQGGLRILAHQEAQQTDVFARPRLRPVDTLLMVYGALFHRIPPS